MDDKKIIRISKTTVFVAIAMIVIIIIMTIIITAYLLSRFYHTNIAELERLTQLNEAIYRLENKNDDLVADLENKNGLTNDTNQSGQENGQ